IFDNTDLHAVHMRLPGLEVFVPAVHDEMITWDPFGNPEAVVGCGPFRLTEWVPGDHLVMDRWDKYFKAGEPHVDCVQIRVIKDPITQVAALKAGEIDMVLSFSPEHV